MRSDDYASGWRIERGSMRSVHGQYIPKFLIGAAYRGVPYWPLYMARRTRDVFSFVRVFESCVLGNGLWENPKWFPDWRARLQRMLLDEREARLGWRYRDDVERGRPLGSVDRPGYQRRRPETHRVMM